MIHVRDSNDFRFVLRIVKEKIYDQSNANLKLITYNNFILINTIIIRKKNKRIKIKVISLKMNN